MRENDFPGGPAARNGESKDRKEQLNIVTVYPQDLLAVKGNEGWEEIEFYVDSGATETVVGEDMLSSVEVREGMAKKRGVQYEVANGLLIPNLGEKRFRGIKDEGVTRNITTQVCDVNNPF